MELDPNQMPNVHAVQQEQVGAAEQAQNEWARAAALVHAKRSGSPEPYKRRVSVKRRSLMATVGDDFYSVSHTHPPQVFDQSLPMTDENRADFDFWADFGRGHIGQRHRGFRISGLISDGVSDEGYIERFRDLMFGIAPGGDRRREARHHRPELNGRYPSVPGDSGQGNWFARWSHARGHETPDDGFPLYFPQNPGFYKGPGPYS